ncbi:T-cell leukemia translocation-altered gene protein homolog isoform X3 [Narcine bancroftii]|uniref:T-cell leukemia translocation-altered gene protein homolog isoform X3 n=1 Tax=Narcine bancroftii TaxID=1343680 RepID=UPI0038322FD5
MELPWDLGLFSGLVQSALSFCSEFARDWGANDMRVTVFKILLGWLLCSLVAIHLAWKFYGATVNDMYYRQDAIKIFSRIRCPSFTGANQHSSFSPSRKKREWRSEWWHSRWILKLFSLGKYQWRVI